MDSATWRLRADNHKYADGTVEWCLSLDDLLQIAAAEDLLGFEPGAILRVAVDQVAKLVAEKQMKSDGGV